MYKSIKCEICGAIITKKYLKKHQTTKKCINNKNSLIAPDPYIFNMEKKEAYLNHECIKWLQAKYNEGILNTFQICNFVEKYKCEDILFHLRIWNPHHSEKDIGYR